MNQVLYYANVKDEAVFSPEGPRPRVLQETARLKTIVAGLEPGQKIPPHPGGLGVYHFLEGSGWMITNGERFAIAPGATLIVPEGATRGIEAETRLVFLATRVDES